MQPRTAWSRSPNRLTDNHAAATVHPLATQAAMELLQQGGNAIDAAVAAALVLGVVDGHNSGIGGGCLVLLRLADGRIRAIDGRETAGAAALPDMFVRDGKLDPNASQTGPLACGVPGQVAALHRMHRGHGSLPWQRLFERAIALADSGHAISSSVAKTIASEAEAIAKFPAARRVLLNAEGQPPVEGDWLIQKDLAKTLTLIAQRGPDWFYREDFAKACCDSLTEQGGILTRNDFERYQALDRLPIAIEYRGRSVVGFPTPSSGGMHIAQMLTMLKPFDLKRQFAQAPAGGYHLLAECMKRAFADRAYWLGDSDFVEVPNSLLDPIYAATRMADFSETQVTLGVGHGLPPNARPRSDQDPKSDISNDAGKHTTHLTVADSQGNWVAMTCTVNTSWGSKLMVPGTGVVLNNEMDDFSIAPGIPNAFGLVGSEANAVGPYKRPLSSMSPTLVLDPDGLPVVTCGAAGGPRIINATLQVLIRTLDLGETITQAIAAPRIHQQWRPDVLFVEDAIGRGTPNAIAPETLASLQALGHHLKNAAGLGVAQGIQRNGRQLVAAHDPRANGESMD